MENTKFLKAYCKRSKQYYSLEIMQYGESYEVVNMDLLSDTDARAVASDNIRQEKFFTHDNLLPCSKCGSREVSGCKCAHSLLSCRPGMKYNFNCVYCKYFEIDYSKPKLSDTRGLAGKTVTVQGKEIKVVNFSNVEWTHFDYIDNHIDGRKEGGYDEPKVHVIANNQNIEFHGYNISEMNEGVYYTIGQNDDFDIECDVDTTTIRPHPGGCLYIDFGEIKAEISLEGGAFFLGGREVGKVGSKFKMRLSLTEEGLYSIYINGKLLGKLVSPVQSEVHVTFGFKHGGHHCHELSHAYMRGIKMEQAVAQ